MTIGLRDTSWHYIINFQKLTSSFVTLIYWSNRKGKFLIRLYLENHKFEYLPYNNLTNTRLPQDVLCNTIYYMTTNDSMRNAQLKSFKLITQILMNPNASHHSYAFGDCGQKLTSITVRFVMSYRNRPYTSEKSKVNDHSNKALVQDPI
jgi:hypothetical protein